jgi:RNase P/RNase MRP subunit p29
MTDLERMSRSQRMHFPHILYGKRIRIFAHEDQARLATGGKVRKWTATCYMLRESCILSNARHYLREIQDSHKE